MTGMTAQKTGPSLIDLDSLQHGRGSRESIVGDYRHPLSLNFAG
jgi:hypothetical protein